MKFDDIEIKEYIFYQNINPISINDIDINKIVISNKLPFGKKDFKYSIAYQDLGVIRPLYIFRQQMIIYKRSFNENRQLLFNKRRKRFYCKFNRKLMYNKNI